MISVGGFRWREREVPEGGYCDTSSPPKRASGCRDTTQRRMPPKRNTMRKRGISMLGGNVRLGRERMN